MLKGLAGIAGIGVIAALAAFWFVCPCEQVPGGPLAGERAPGAVADWSFVNDVRLCQVEVSRAIPWSVNLNCMSAAGALYISCSRCAGKGWSQAALDDPLGYIRVRETVYPVRFTRLIEPATLDLAWQARARKLGLEGDPPRPDHWWSFQLKSRS